MTNPEMERIPLPTAPSFARNDKRRAGASSTMSCAICAMGVKNPAGYLRIVAAENYAIVARSGWASIVDGEDLGFRPVGSNCARKYPQVRPYLVRADDTQ